jgi:hypothetical protein
MGFHTNNRWSLMGDKSPRSKIKKQKQDSSQKDRKKEVAYAKAHPAPPEPLKKGK